MKGDSTGLAFGAMVCRVLVGGLFIITAIGKISEPAVFLKQVRGFELAPFVLTNAIAYLLPWLELIAGGLFALGVWRRENGVILSAMLLVFTAAKIIVFAQGRVVDCGCGGSFQFLKVIFDNPQGIITNIVLLGLTIVGMMAAAPRPQAPVEPAPAV